MYTAKVQAEKNYSNKNSVIRSTVCSRYGYICEESLATEQEYSTKALHCKLVYGT